MSRKERRDEYLKTVCGQPIWAIGSATVDWDGCFTCITGEADESEDYEIESVCF